MHFQIKEIILWPRDTTKAIRRLPFELGKVNVITGASRTGKSAVIPIIDYCLGAGDCAIPVKTIREYCSWFGVIVQTAEGEKLFARKEPGEQKQADSMCFLESPEAIDIPNSLPQPSGMTTVDEVKQRLNALSGLSRLKLTADAPEKSWDSPAGFRDLMAFNFQPQNVIANHDVLFFKANQHEHRERLRRLFPLVLNAITPEVLALEHERMRLTKLLREKARVLEAMQQKNQQWLADLQGHHGKARELGLLPQQSIDGRSYEELRRDLEAIAARTDVVLEVTAEAINSAVTELAELDRDETTQERKVSALKRRLGEVERIKSSAEGYGNAMRVQRDRLKISTWLTERGVAAPNCPICGSEIPNATEVVNHLAQSAKAFESAANQSVEIPVVVDRELARLRNELDAEVETLRAIQIRRRELTQASESARNAQFRLQDAARFVGGLDQSLKLHRMLDVDSSLTDEVTRLQSDLNVLERRLKGLNTKQKTEIALATINTNAGRLLPQLDNDRKDDPVSLEISNLTIKVGGKDGRFDYLYEIGSGSNWLSYHVAMMLGLHQFFLKQDHSPVPSFLVMDQPSQVYFPRRLAEKKSDELLDPQLPDEDVAAVRATFKVLGEVVDTTKGQLQVIVLDHASESVWGNLTGVVLADEWRDGTKLVPVDWIPSEVGTPSDPSPDSPAKPGSENA